VARRRLLRRGSPRAPRASRTRPDPRRAAGVRKRRARRGRRGPRRPPRARHR